MQSSAVYSEEGLLRRLKAGEETAFTEIYNQYWQQLFFMAHKRLQSGEDAREIVQNVFLTLWSKRQQLEIQSLPMYLAAMTRYAIYRHLANEKRRADQVRQLELTTNPMEKVFDLDTKQFLEILTRLSNALPEKYRLVFIHHKMLDRPLEEVARELGVSPRTAEDYVTRVMAIMRKHRRRLAFSILLF